MDPFQSGEQFQHDNSSCTMMDLLQILKKILYNTGGFYCDKCGRGKRPNNRSPYSSGPSYGPRFNNRYHQHQNTGFPPQQPTTGFPQQQQQQSQAALALQLQQQQAFIQSMIQNSQQQTQQPQQVLDPIAQQKLAMAVLKGINKKTAAAAKASSDDDDTQVISSIPMRKKDQKCRKSDRRRGGADSSNSSDDSSDSETMSKYQKRQKRTIVTGANNTVEANSSSLPVTPKSAADTLS